MAISDERALIWLGIFRRRPLVLSSARPEGECLRLLAEVTTLRGPLTWHLDPRTATLPEPRFHGEVSPSRITLCRFGARGGGNSFYAGLDARPGPGAGGGTTLSGEIGAAPGLSPFMIVYTGLVCLVSVGLLAAGIAQLVLGYLIGLAPALAFPLPVAVIAGFNFLGHRSLERDVSALLREVNAVLGSTAAFPRPSANSAAGSSDA